MAQTKSLPPRPNLEHLKKQAKSLLKFLRQSKPTARLADAQVALARDYGFSSWRSLKSHVDSIAKSRSAIDLNNYPKQAQRQMDRAWAESCAIIERRFDVPGSASCWESTGLASPTLREREADERIIHVKQMGQYRMASVWLQVKVDNARNPVVDENFKATRLLEFLRPGTPGAVEGIWRRMDWKPTNQGFSGKPPRWDDLTEALTYLGNAAPPGEYRIVTIRRMLFAQQLKDRIKIDKKHAGLTTLDRVEHSVSPAKTQWSVESLPEHRKTHKIAQWKPIMDAAFCGNADKVKALLNAGADPNVLSTTPHRYRPLHRAIEHKKTLPKTERHEQVVKVLLAGGADPKLRATGGQTTALQLAAIGEPRFIPFLRDYFEPLDIFHSPVLADAPRVGSLLKDNSALAKASDENAWTALHYCAASDLHRVDAKTSDALVEIARMLLQAGADPMANWQFNGEWPLRPLYYACGRSNNPAIARVLLEAGADPCDSESVYHASDEGHNQCLALIEEFVKPAKLAKECSLCLNVQLHWGHTRGMRWLLDHGANPAWVHPTYKTSAIQEATRKRRTKVIELLESYMGKIKPSSAHPATRARPRALQPRRRAPRHRA